MINDTNTTMVAIESWFIPMDILFLVCSILTILLSTIFLLIVATHRTCRTVSMMLICNSCLSELSFGLTVLGMTIFTLNNDMKQIVYDYPMCEFLGYMGFVTSALQNYSYMLQAIYRYITVVYPSRHTWASARFQGYLIVGVWIFSFMYMLPSYLTGHVTYNVDNQICQGALQLSVENIYKYIFLSGTPILTTMFVYVKLIRYVHNLNARSTSVNIKNRAKRELKLLRRVIILVTIIVILGLPYCLFLLISFFTAPPKYHFRIAYAFVDVSLFLVMVVLFKFTQPVYDIVFKMLRRHTMIEPIVGQNMAKDKY